MDVKEYFSLKKEVTNYCNKGKCWDSGFNCPLSIIDNGKGVRCSVLEQDYPEVAEKLLQNYKEKKEAYVNCMQDLQKQLISKCNKYESCTECRKENL